MPHQALVILIFAAAFGGFFIFVSIINNRTLDIKSKTVGDGQHGTARFATDKEVYRTYTPIPFTPARWRVRAPTRLPQGIVIGYRKSLRKVTALVDTSDVHALMIGAAGVGKTAKFLYPNLEYACASGVSFVTSDTKGDLVRSYGAIARDYYGYDISIIDLRNPTQSDTFNMLYLVNRYMDSFLTSGDISAKAKAEKYAKITAKTIIYSGGFSITAAG